MPKTSRNFYFNATFYFSLVIGGGISFSASAQSTLFNFVLNTDFSSTLGSGIASASISRANLGNGYIGNDGFGKVLEAYPIASSTSAVNTTSYFTISYAANAGNTFNLSALNFYVGKGGNNDPRGFKVFSSADNYTTQYLSAQLSPTGGKAAPALYSIDLSSLPSERNVSSGTFRFYVYAPTVGNSIDWANITLLGVLSGPSGVLSGPSVANTNQSLVNTATSLQGTYTLQNSVIANSFSYDCNVFGANNVCVSAGGRNTTVQAANGLNNTSALLIAAYRPHPNYRIGAYADQNLSVSNAGGTVNLGNNTPVIGLFGAWTQRLNGTGAEVKVSAAYGQKNTTITRSVVGSGDGASEAGSGSSTLNSQGAQLTAKYGFGIADNVIVSPYVGMRYTQNNMGGYTEATSSSVTAPLTYSALNTNATTALAGVGASYRVIPAVTTFASAGVETDTNTANGTYSATNASIGTLTPVNFNANPVRTRPTATLGAYYDVAKNQRLGVTGIYRQEAYQAVSTTTVMATYTIGL